MKISVIIPMYNAEAFITQCISSVQNQTYSNWEIIVIDDGSTDRSWEICKTISLTDNRIYLYKQEHGGISHTRNYGLEIATGEYIFFLDSDDAIHPLLLEELMEQTQKYGLDMIFCNYVSVEGWNLDRVLHEASVNDKRPCWKIAEGMEIEEWFHVRYCRELSRISGMIKKESIGTLRFDESLVIGEDTLFMYQLFCKQMRTSYSPCTWYFYRIHKKSITHSKDAVKKGYFDGNRIIRDIEYKRGRYEFAVNREAGIVFQLNKYYAECKKRKDKVACSRIKMIAKTERKDPLFRLLGFSIRLRYVCCFYCHPVYAPLNKLIVKVWEWWERSRNGEK